MRVLVQHKFDVQRETLVKPIRPLKIVSSMRQQTEMVLTLYQGEFPMQCGKHYNNDNNLKPKHKH